MSLNGVLNIGASALNTAQAQLQVTGNNIANVGNPNYSREVATTSATADQQLEPGIYIGTGVDLTGVQRQVDNALNQRLNSAISDNQSASTAQQWTSQVQSIFNALGSQNLDTQINQFQQDWSALASNPSDTSQRQVVLQDGSTLAQQFNSLASNLNDLQGQAGQQLTNLASSANQLAQQIATLNQQIATSGGGNNALLDQRDAAVQQLSQLVNVQTVNQGNGTVNVYVGSEPLVMGTVNRGLKVSTSTTAGQPTYQLQFAADNGPVPATSGQLGAMLSAQSQISGVLGQLNTLASGVIFGVNSLHASGQGLEGFTSTTSTNQVLDPTAVLNSAGAGLAFQPTNGSFVVTVTNKQTGLASSTLVPVNLTGATSGTTLNSLATSLSAIPNVSATIQGGMLTIASTDPNQTITFSQDSSHVLASLGINTFFTGSTAGNMGVNSTITNNPSLIAAAQNGQTGDNQTALAIANLSNLSPSVLGGSSVQNYYSSMINGIGSTASQANTDAQSTLDIVNTLQSQQQSLSGVNMDDETINMLQQQRAYQGAAMIINTVNQMTTALMQMVG